VNSITAPFKLVTKIGSPSKLFRQYGVWLGQGLALGIDDGAARVASAATGLAEKVGAAVHKGLAAAVNTGDVLFPLEAKLRELQAQAERLQNKLSSASSGSRSTVGTATRVHAGSRGQLAVIAGGRMLQGQGLQVAESKYFGGVTTNRHAHYANDHYSGNSIDVNAAGGGAAELSRLNAALKKLKATFGSMVNAFIEDAGTANQHLHATFKNVNVAAKAAVKATGNSSASGVSATAFARSILSGLGIKETNTAIKSLLGWFKAEGTKAKNNPLATTLSKPGHDSTFNSVGVRNYDTASTGIAATVQTLMGSAYKAIRDALRNGASPDQFSSIVNASPWGTKNPFGSAIRSAQIGSGGVIGGDGGSVADGYAKSLQAMLQINERQQKAIQQAIAWRDAMKQIRTEVGDKLTAAVDKYRAKWEATKGALFDLQTADMVANSPAAKALADLQAQQEAADRAAEDISNAQAMTDALASGDQSQINAAQKQIDDTNRARQMADLQKQAETEAFTIEQDRAAERAKMKRQDVEDYKTAESDKLNALVASLNQQQITYATFVRNVRALLKGIGLSFDASPDLEAAILGGKGALSIPAAGAAVGKMVGSTAATVASVGSGIGSLMGSYETGTDWVPRTGPYLLHRGEAVVPADQNRAGGGGVVVQQIHNGNVINNSPFDVERHDRERAFRLENVLRGLGG
jgi:hypothetical protein